MIVDSIENLEKYAGLNPLFPKAIAYIQSLDLKKLEIEKKEIEGKDLFVMVGDSTLKKNGEPKLEAHNQYIDIQIPISKPESFGWSPRTEMKTPIGTFDETKDIQFFEDDYSILFELKPGNFVIFFPQDAHAPCIGEGSVLKIIVKVKI